MMDAGVDLSAAGVDLSADLQTESPDSAALAGASGVVGASGGTVETPDGAKVERLALDGASVEPDVVLEEATTSVS